MTSFPIVLFGRDYWQGLFDWLAASTLDDAYISPADLDMVLITDDVRETLEHVTGVRRAGRRGAD